jgi:prepilin-type N-terminal cleavage/methylation domain-containing protein
VNNMEESAADGDGGFSLIELLVVIVILGVLAAVVVFATRSTTPAAQEETCRSVARTYRTAIEAWYGSADQQADADGHPSGAEIESAQLIRRYDDTYVRILVPSDAGYVGPGRSTVAPVPGGSCDGLIQQG